MTTFKSSNICTVNTETDNSAGFTILIPAYDELPNLRVLLPEISTAINSLPHNPKEILVVLASFATISEVNEITNLGAKTVIRSPTNSFGDAIRTGFANASAFSEYIITIDADGSHSPATIPKLLAVAPGAHLVTGSRYMKGGSTDVKLSLRIMSRLLNFAFGFVFGLESKDLSGNFKLYKKSSLSNFTLDGKNFDVLQELIFKMKVHHGSRFVVKEVPYHFSERNTGKSKRKLLSFIVSYLKTLLKLILLSLKFRFK